MTNEDDGRVLTDRALASEAPTGLQPPAFDPSRIDWARLVAECSDPGEGPGAQYWRDHASRPYKLKPLGRPCYDCAVTQRFYTAFSIDLASQPADVVEAVCANWFCHDNPDRACRGNIDLVAFIRDSDASLAEDPKGLSGEAVAARAEGIAQGDPA